MRRVTTRMKMKPNNRPRRLTDVFVPFSNLAAVIRAKLRGLRNLSGTGTGTATATATNEKKMHDEKNATSTAARDGQRRKPTRGALKTRTNFKANKRTKNKSMRKAAAAVPAMLSPRFNVNVNADAEVDEARTQTKPQKSQSPSNSILHAVRRGVRTRRPEKTFIAFKAASKRRRQLHNTCHLGKAATDSRMSRSTLPTITADADADADANSNANANNDIVEPKTVDAKANGPLQTTQTQKRKQKQKQKQKRTNATTTDVQSENKRKFIDKMRRLRDIDTVIHKRSSGIKFTSTVGVDRVSSRSRYDDADLVKAQAQTQAQTQSTPPESRVQFVVANSSGTAPAPETEFKLRTRTYLIDKQRRRCSRYAKGLLVPAKELLSLRKCIASTNANANANANLSISDSESEQ